MVIDPLNYLFSGDSRELLDQINRQERELSHLAFVLRDERALVKLVDLD